MEPKARIDFDARLCLPNHALFVGASQSGKTRLCLHLLANPQLFHPRPSRIIFCFDQPQDHYTELHNRLAALGIELMLYKGMDGISIDMIEKQEGQTILILDDFSEESSSSNQVARIVTNGRHKNLSCWLVWHSLFSRHAASRVVCQNVRWFFFLPSLRLEAQLRTFGSQLGLRERLLAAFRDVQSHDQRQAPSGHRYVMLDSGPNTPDVMRVRTRVDDVTLQYCYC